MEKTGRILGVPYDLRFPTMARFKARVWNADDPRIVVPRVFGAGWTINLAALKQRSTPGFYLVLALYLFVAMNIVRSTLKALRGSC